MKKLFILVLTLSLFIFSGCTRSAYSTSDVGKIEQLYTATVKSARTIELSDDGAGTILGAIIGAVAGHQIGKGSGNTAATFTGALAGGMVGSEMNKALGQELHLEFSDGRIIATTIKIDDQHPYSFREGDIVNVYMRYGRIKKILPKR